MDIVNIINFVCTVVGCITSVVGLFLSYLVFKNVKKLAASFLIRGTLPKILKDLDEYQNGMNECLNGTFSTENKSKFSEISSKIAVSFENLIPKLLDYDKKYFENQVKGKIELFSRAKKAFADDPSKQNARETKKIVGEIIWSLQLFANDEPWRNTQ